MKKTISALLVCALLVCSVFALASCGKKLSGAYESALGTTYEFSGNKVTMTQEIPFLDDVVIEGTYEITEDEDGKTVIIFTVENEDDEDKDFAGKFSFSEGEEDGTKYIKIAGIKYEKVEKK